MCTLRVGASNFLSWSPAPDFSFFARARGTILGPLFSSEPKRVSETSEDNSGRNEPRIHQIFALKLGEQHRLKVPKTGSKKGWYFRLMRRPDRAGRSSLSFTASLVAPSAARCHSTANKSPGSHSDRSSCRPALSSPRRARPAGSRTASFGHPVSNHPHLQGPSCSIRTKPSASPPACPSDRYLNISC